MMDQQLERMLEGCEVIKARGYHPRQLFRFARLVLYGDKGAGCDGTPRKHICPTEYKHERERERRSTGGGRWYCVGCGAVVRQGHICDNCGEDNHYPILLGIAKRVEDMNNE